MLEKLYPAKFYPAGAPELAAGLNGVGIVLDRMGRYLEAKKYLERGLAIYQKQYPADRYPAGHIDIARCLANLSLAASALNQHDKAFEYATEAIKTQRQLIDREIAVASETEALTLLREVRYLEDFYLSLALAVPGSDDAVYRNIWGSKAALMRILEQRHAAARLAGKDSAAKLVQLHDMRRQIERLIQNSAFTAEERDKQLAALADQRDRLERELAVAVPVLSQWKERN